MQEFYLNLSKSQKSLSKILLGTFTIVYSIVWIILLTGNNNMQLFNTASAVWMLIIGTAYCYEGTGRTFGKKFIEVTEEYIKIKAFPFKSASIYYLNDIISITVGMVKIDIIDSNDKLHEIDLSAQDYRAVIELKRMFAELSGRLKLGRRNEIIMRRGND